MAFLICTFASPRSRQEKIHEWLRYLDELERLHGSHPDRLHTIHMLRARATGWLEGTDQQDQEPWGAVSSGTGSPVGNSAGSVPTPPTDATIVAEPPAI
jgi:hypothetical protein